MARFFALFDHIKTVVVEDLRMWGRRNDKYHVVEALRNTLGDVTIDRLEVRDHDVGRELQWVNHVFFITPWASAVS